MMESLPKGWVVSFVRDVSQYFRGITYKKEQSSTTSCSGMLPIIRANNIDGALCFDNLVFVKETLISDEQKIKTGDIVFAMSSGSKKHVGKCAISTKDFKGSFGAFCGLLRPIHEINNIFLSYSFKYREFRHYIESISKGTNINNLKRGHLLDYKLPLPPTNEQRRIVAKIEELFSELDKGVESLKLAQAQLKTYRQSILKHAFEGKLTAKWREENRIDYQWTKQLVSEIGRIETGNTPSKKNPEYFGGNIPFYKPKDLSKGSNIFETEEYLTEKGFDKARKIPTNSILVTCIGATIGKTGLIKKEGASNQQINAIIPNENYLSEFIYFQAISFLFQEQINYNYSQTTLPILNKNKFSKLTMVVCPIEEQQQIISEIEAKFSVIDQLEKDIEENLKRSETLRQSILKKAFSGQLVPQDSNDEPASELLKRIKAQKTTKASTKQKKSAS